MNEYICIGRLTKDPVMSETKVKKTKVAVFTLAIPRFPKVEGQPEADFLRTVVFGKIAENCEKYLVKGSLVSITGKIQTRNYKKDDHTVFVTELIARNVEFLDFRKKNNEEAQEPVPVPETPENYDIPSDFSEIDEEDIPF